MLQVDQSLLIQIVNFLVLVILLNIFLYRPIRRIIAQRGEEVGSLQSAIQEYQGKAEENEKGIQEQMVEARKEGFQVKESLKTEGLEQEKGILQKSGSAVEEKISAARSKIEGQLKDVRKTLDDQVAVFSKDLAEKILGRSVA
ncbi:MAG: ATP synthase F0 subunit B [Deltaproteobacteria bacterium]|jgi:F-type H+-transporting ATPase subunit b